MKPPKCRLCGAEHWNNEDHVLPSATNIAAATNKRLTDATNKNVAKGELSVGGEEVEVTQGVVSKTANRRSREAYNAYQRDYMRKRRNERKVDG